MVKNINIDEFVYLLKDNVKSTEFFIRKGKCTTDESALRGPITKKTFKMGKVIHVDRVGDDYAFEGYIRLSSKRWEIMISSYKFLNWLALVGGSLASINSVCAFVVKNWNYTDYMK